MSHRWALVGSSNGPSAARISKLCGHETDLTRLHVSPGAVTDVENPNRPIRLIHFVENSVDVAPFTEEEASNLALCLLGFASERASIGQSVERVEAIHQLLEPFGALEWGCRNDRFVDVVSVGLRGVCETDAVWRASFGTLFQNSPPRLPDRPLRRRGPA